MVTLPQAKSDRNVDPFSIGQAGFLRKELSTKLGKMNYFYGGNGPTVLLLHGIGGGAGSYYWSRLAPLLAESYTVIAPDLVGWNSSYHPGRFLEFSDYQAQIAFLIKHFGKVKAVVAQSLSAGFSIAALNEDCSLSVERLILLAPTGGRDFGKDAFDPLFRFTLSALARIPFINQTLYRAYFHRRSSMRFWFQSRGFLDARQVPDKLVEAAYLSAIQPRAAFSALPFVGGSLRYDIAPLIERINRPALMLWGAKESQIKSDVRRRLMGLNSQFVRHETIADARTNFEIEQPQATATAIKSFLLSNWATLA